MAATVYSQTLDNMVTTAIDSISSDPVNALTDSGEKFLSQAARSGRVFVVNDAENVRHTVLYDHGTASALYIPDKLDGSKDAGTALSSAAKEVITQCLFTLQAGTRNINFPQSQPAGNLIDYVTTVVKANMMHIFNEEEQLFVRGNAGAVGTGSVSVKRSPFQGDSEDYSDGIPMSLPGLLLGSSSNADGPAAATTLAEAFAGIKSSQISRWEPYAAQTTGTSNKHDKLISDLQAAIMQSSYSETERPTHVYMQSDSFEALLSLLRDKAALPDPVNYDIGKEGTISFGGVTCDWSRYLSKEKIWDNDSVSPGDTATYPMLGINWNSLRLNTVRAGTTSGEIGFIRTLGSMLPHPTVANLFKRIEWKRQWSVDNGRRSFFKIFGLQNKATS